MDLALFLIDFILHVDRHLAEFVAAYGPWVYALLFLIVFVETGLVVMPFLPGDSLLFVTGALAGAGLIDINLVIVLLLVAAIAGDQVNYTIGARVGQKVWTWEQSRWFNRRAFEQAHDFYERYGGITIIIARFMPFIRTFAPFVAGVAAMRRGTFTLYNVVGALIWVVGLTLAGYWFGNLPWVQQNLSKIIWALIIVPGLIAIFGAWKARRAADQRAQSQSAAGLRGLQWRIDGCRPGLQCARIPSGAAPNPAVRASVAARSVDCVRSTAGCRGAGLRPARFDSPGRPGAFPLRGSR